MKQGVIETYSSNGNPTETFSTGFAYWTSFAAATVSGAVAAKIQPGRRNARQALAYVCEAPRGDVRPFARPHY